ncbi:MAG: GNAT family N-acetyltransferase, partial [Gammaproteobacteria bacterium]|nr:GNAT family N-acetyltransferase [Gammaproteobacteria bacterium]
MAVRFDIPKSGFTIREAVKADAKAVRMLLPHLPGDTFSMVALDRKYGLIVGAASILKRVRSKPPIGPGIVIHVIEPCRRTGIATALLEEMAKITKTHGGEALYAIQKAEVGSAEMQAWEWLKFKSLETVEEHVLPLDQFEPRLIPLLDRMRAKGKIPDSARMIPLHQANKEAVLQLHLEHMGGNSETILSKLHTEVPGSYHPRYSRVLMVDDKVMGCILAHRKSKDVASVDADIIHPSIRGGWANIWLKLEATQGALSLGIRDFHFTSFDRYEDTRSFTK